MSDIYNKDFYIDQMDESRLSAQEILPLLFSSLERPESVVDVGCGTGSWLVECLAQSIDDIMGIDGGDGAGELLQIPQEKFISSDLLVDLCSLLNRRFDLAINLEVAEHLPHNEAENFIARLTQLADTVLFSAAIPYQGGTGHINEQWQDYWATLFRKFDFYPLDIIRPQVWGNEKVCWWYRQNIVVFVKREVLLKHSPDYDFTRFKTLNLVHPNLYLWACARDKEQPGNMYNEDLHALNAATYRLENNIDDYEIVKVYSELYENSFVDRPSFLKRGLRRVYQLISQR